MATEAEIYHGLTEIFHDVFMRDDIVLSADLTAKQLPGGTVSSRLKSSWRVRKNGRSGSTHVSWTAFVASATSRE